MRSCCRSGTAARFDSTDERKRSRGKALDPAWLDRCSQWLDQHGQPPFILVESWEEPGFRSRFVEHSNVGKLDWPPKYEIDRVVRIFDPRIAPATIAASGSIPNSCGRCATDAPDAARHAIAQSLFDANESAGGDRSTRVSCRPIRFGHRRVRKTSFFVIVCCDYHAGDLERDYASLDVEEDYLYAYGFLSQACLAAAASAQNDALRALRRKVLDESPLAWAKRIRERSRRTSADGAL